MSHEDNFNDYLKGEKENICYRISFHRVDQKMSFTELSEKTEIPVAELESIELGTCQFDFEKICKIGFAFEVGLHDLVKF